MLIEKLLFSYFAWLTYYLSYYFGNISYPIIYPIITFTYRKVKFYPINNSSPDAGKVFLERILSEEKEILKKMDEEGNKPVIMTRVN